MDAHKSSYLPVTGPTLRVAQGGPEASSRSRRLPSLLPRVKPQNLNSKFTIE